MLLALETATDVCSVVFKNENGEVFEKLSHTKGTHSENLFLFIDELMAAHSFKIKELNAALVSEGPGSYTGLRIAASGVKGLLLGSHVPLYGVNTLASFAMAATVKQPETTFIHSVIDARRKHLYHQSFSFKAGKLEALNAIEIRPIEKVEQMIEPEDVIIGTGLNRLNPAILQNAILMGEEAISSASLISLFEQTEANQFYRKVDAAEFSPKYYNQQKMPQITNS